MRVDTGVTGLDEMLGGGLLPGRVVLLSGSAGTGKTTMAMQFIQHGVEKHNEPGVFITMEQSKEKIREDMEALGMDMRTKKMTLIGGSTGQIMKYQAKTKARLEDFLDEIEEVVTQAKAKRVVIDSINLFLMLFPTLDEKRHAMLAITELLTRLGCTSMLTCEIKENCSDISWYGFEEFVADGVINLMNMKYDSYFTNALAVRKMRGIAHDRSIVSYKMTNRGIKVFPKEQMVKG